MRAGTEDAARVDREGDALRFHGPVLREQVATLWLAAIPLLAGARTLDLSGVGTLDSAGLALFGELMQRNPGLQLASPPAEFEALRQAYRLDPRLQPLA
jgi:phospholipid transport system transporter-binding protein